MSSQRNLNARSGAGLFVIFAAALAFLSVSHSRAAEPALNREAALKLLRTVTERQENQGDYHASIFINQKESNKNTIAFEAQVYRRSTAEQFVFVLTAPKADHGRGYLRIDRNLWIYEPTVGKWERRTERERLGGTNATRSDLDEARLDKEYEPAFEAEEKVGAFQTYRLLLTAKKGIDVNYPIVRLWIDKATSNIVKREDMASSGKLMRTNYYTKWTKIYSDSKKGDIWYAKETNHFDEIDKGNSTQVIVKAVDVKPLEANIFTKAWLEGKSG